MVLNAENDETLVSQSGLSCFKGVNRENLCTKNMGEDLV